MLELLTGLIVAIAAVALVLEPLVRRGPVRQPVQDEEPVELDESQSPKIKALLALREIEFDRATGKLSDDDYALLKEQYSHAALAAMDAEGREQAEPAHGDVEVDAVIQRMRKRKRECSECGIRPEPTAAFCSRCGRSLTAADARARCWMCGTPREPNGRYCIECGEEIPEIPSPPGPLRNAG